MLILYGTLPNSLEKNLNPKRDLLKNHVGNQNIQQAQGLYTFPFLSFGVRRHSLITGLSGSSDGEHPINHVRPKKLSQRTGGYLVFDRMWKKNLSFKYQIAGSTFKLRIAVSTVTCRCVSLTLTYL